MNDMRIKLLETQIDKNTFDDMEILEGTNAIFPAINSLSLANHTFYTNKESSYSKTVLVCQAEKELNKDDQ